MPRCPDCDERVSSSETECPNCGAALRPGKKKSGGGTSTATILLIVAGVAIGGLVICGGIMAALLLPAVQQARSAARMAQSTNNLKIIGLAMHNYHDTHTAFPASGTFSEEGQPMHGWMTSLLPFVEQGPLFDSINMNEPWNSATNQTAVSTVVPSYLNPGIQQKTSAEGYGLAHYAGNSQVLSKNEFRKFHTITDGSSNTVLAGEVSSDFMPWASPENVRNPAAGLGKSATQFGGVVPGRTVMLMCDGAARVVRDDINPDILNAIATPKGNEPVGEF